MSENTLTVEGLKQVEQRWATSKDRASMMAIYTEDAIFDNINKQPVIGKNAMQANFEAMEQEGAKGQVTTFENCEAVVMGNWGYTSGTWRGELPSGSVKKGTYLHVIKLVDGEAKIFRQIFELAEQS